MCERRGSAVRPAFRRIGCVDQHRPRSRSAELPRAVPGIRSRRRAAAPRRYQHRTESQTRETGGVPVRAAVVRTLRVADLPGAEYDCREAWRDRGGCKRQFSAALAEVGQHCRHRARGRPQRRRRLLERSCHNGTTARERTAAVDDLTAAQCRCERFGQDRRHRRSAAYRPERQSCLLREF